MNFLPLTGLAIRIEKIPPLSPLPPSRVNSRLKSSLKMVEIFSYPASCISTYEQIPPLLFHDLLLTVEIVWQSVEIYNHNTSTKRSSNLAPFDKISKSGDGGASGDIVGMVDDCI